MFYVKDLGGMCVLSEVMHNLAMAAQNAKISLLTLCTHVWSLLTVSDTHNSSLIGKKRIQIHVLVSENPRLFLGHASWVLIFWWPGLSMPVVYGLNEYLRGYWCGALY